MKGMVGHTIFYEASYIWDTFIYIDNRTPLVFTYEPCKIFSKTEPDAKLNLNSTEILLQDFFVSILHSV